MAKHGPPTVFSDIPVNAPAVASKGSSEEERKGDATGGDESTIPS